MGAARARPSLDVALGVLAAGAAALVGAGALADNSFLTHLATGRLILDGDGFPRSDPYTFTAAGEGWVVQSWLASVLYAGAEELGGLGAVRAVMVATTAALGALTWTLTRGAGTLAGRLVAFAPAFVVGTGSWTERPLLIGLLGLGVVLLAAEDRLDPRLLVPVGWVWANAHGSWPMGFVALLCLGVGARLDGGDAGPERRAAAWLLAGCALAVLNPYGIGILLFPVRLLARRESLADMVEWGPMTFDDTAQWGLLVLVVVAVLALCNRPSWRAAVPLALFAALALTGLRNVPVAALVLLPGTASGLTGLGSLRGERPSPLAGPVAVVGGLLVAGAFVSVASTDDFADAPFPVAAHRWLVDHDLSPATHRVVARELVGNWFEAVHGATGTVFADDRVEVLPAEVLEDHLQLLRGDPAWEGILGRYEPEAVLWQPEAVLWQAESPLAALLAGDDDWRIGYRDDRWIVAVPAGA